MSSVFGDGLTWDSERGEFINTAHQRIAELIAEYNPYLRLIYIPQNKRTGTEPFTYAIVYAPPSLEPSVIMRLQEHELNETVLARLYQSDTTRSDPLAYLENLERARQAIEERKREELREAAMDKTKFMIRSPLHTINLGNGKKVHT